MTGRTRSFPLDEPFSLRDMRCSFRRKRCLTVTFAKDLRPVPDNRRDFPGVLSLFPGRATLRYQRPPAHQT